VAKRVKTDFQECFEALGKEYRRLRKLKGISQMKVADYNFDPRHYMTFEQGYPHTLNTFFKICKMLDTHPSKVMAKIPKE
jgi:transcriptional regulator with XRE-family HTH domain